MDRYPIAFRFSKKNMYSISCLHPAVPSARILRNPTDGILIYSYFTEQRDEIVSEVTKIKGSKIKKTYMIAGGPHPTGDPEDAVRFFDAAVIGEGEETLRELVRFVQSLEDFNQRDNSYYRGLDKIRGIAYYRNGKTIVTPKRNYIDLNSYPCFLSDSNSISRPIEITRGCPHGCKYCQTPTLLGRKMRHRSVEEILKYAKYYDDIRFITSNAFAYGSNGRVPDTKKTELLLKSLYHLKEDSYRLKSDRPRRIFFGTFPSEVRPEFVTDDMAEILTAYASNKSLSIGAQSGSEKILKEIQRGHTTEDIYNALDTCFRHNIKPLVDIIVGFPTETEEEQFKTLELAKYVVEKKGEVRSHYMTPLPGTTYANEKPSDISPAVMKEFGKMARKGNLKGTWYRKTM